MHKSGQNFFRENPELAKRIEYCVKEIVKVFNPEKIILFGSFARGETSKFKTMDLLVVAETELTFFERIKKVLKACSGSLPPIEPIVYTPSELEMLRNQGEGFLEDALEEGVILYEK